MGSSFENVHILDPNINKNEFLQKETKYILIKKNLLGLMRTLNPITDTRPNQRRYLCHLTSTNFNNVFLSLFKRFNNKIFLNFEMSPLQTWIRLYGFHMSYRFDISKRQI